MALESIKIYRVRFIEPTDICCGDQFFKSIPAIYEKFNPSEIGRKLTTMQNNPPREDAPVVTRKCIVSVHHVWYTSRS